MFLHPSNRAKAKTSAKGDVRFVFDVCELLRKGAFAGHENNSENDIAFIWVFKKFNVLFTLTGDSDQRKFSLSPTVYKPKMIPFINLWPSCRQYCLCFM